EALRFLILRTQPRTPVHFELEEDFMVKLFNDFDRLHKHAKNDDERELYRLCEIAGAEGDFYDSNFQLILTFVQMPHVDLLKEMEKRKGAPLDETELRHLRQRERAARIWVERFMSEQDRIELQASLPARASELGPAQRGFLHAFARAAKTAE